MFWDIAGQDDVDAVVCTTNNFVKQSGHLVMGRGIAEAFKNRFKFLDWNFGQIVQQLKDNGIEDYHVIMDGPRKINHRSVHIVGLQTKRFWGDPSPLELVVESCKHLKDLADVMKWKRVIMTKPGCGLGGLKWSQVKPKIKLDERFEVIDVSDQ